MKRRKENPVRTIVYYLSNLEKAKCLYYFQKYKSLKFKGKLIDYTNCLASEAKINKKDPLSVKFKKNMLELFNTMLNESSKLNKLVDHTTLLYNQALVIIVSSFETYTKALFVSLINGDKCLKEKILSSNKRIFNIKFSDLKESPKEKIDIGEIAAREYNFQDLNSIIKAYKLISFNLYPLISQIKETKGKPLNAFKLVNEVTKKRHKIVHESYNDNEMGYKDIDLIFNLFHKIGMKIYLHCVIQPFLEKGLRLKLKKK